MSELYIRFKFSCILVRYGYVHEQLLAGPHSLRIPPKCYYTCTRLHGVKRYNPEVQIMDPNHRNSNLNLYLQAIVLQVSSKTNVADCAKVPYSIQLTFTTVHQLVLSITNRICL
jgi:hypothetical protein